MTTKNQAKRQIDTLEVLKAYAEAAITTLNAAFDLYFPKGTIVTWRSQDKSRHFGTVTWCLNTDDTSTPQPRRFPQMLVTDHATRLSVWVTLDHNPEPLGD